MSANGSPARPRTGSALSFVARRPVAITMFMVALAVFGAVSFSKLPVDLLQFVLDDGDIHWVEAKVIDELRDRD